MERRAVVVGAGVGGLAVGAALVRDGWQVTVLERGDQVRAVGSGLALWANAVRAIEFVDPEAAKTLRGRPTMSGVAGLRVPSGSWLMRADMERLRAESTVDAPIMVERPELHALLARNIPDSAFRVGRTATSVTQADGRAVVNVRTEVGVEEYAADLVVAADGIGSGLRTSVDPAATITSARYLAWRGIVPADGAPEAPFGGETWGRGQRFGYIPLSDGGIYWYATLDDDRPRANDTGDQQRLLRELFARWHAPIPALIDATPPEQLLRNEVSMLWPQPTTYVAGRVALLGDAAHAMTPDLAQGAAQALEDAVELAVAVRDADPAAVPAALQAYDALRRPRASGLASQSRRIGRISQLSTPVGATLRDTVIRLIPSKLLAGGFGKAADWQPSRPH